MDEILDQIHKDRNPGIKEEPSETSAVDRKRKLSDSAHESSGESNSRARKKKKKKKRKGNSKQTEDAASSAEFCNR